MTPAIDLAKKRNLDYQVHEYTHDSNAASFGLEAAEKLGVAVTQVFKTLVVITDTGVLAVAILPVDKTLNFKKMAKALSSNKLLSCKKVQMADPKQVERSTGYVLGGVSPLGQKKRLKTVIDSTAQDQATVYVSGGRRGLEIELPPAQLAITLHACFSGITDE
ncbi:MULTISPECIES: Cys-tRNA(Pro) deacylase [unclassified Psychrobacter]|uniref:Cys-tRNA(Pro) deacylase n=1 Tax=unclassified Psychrobacter TaxID=196806 RepID=UPI00086D3F9A|nr:MULTISPECIES: Cys-tRNA(Pro) deacylase [unclassified Psychrobacter]OEH68006.1 MAG: aminoacyl-tRNA deacylase [Psychrobacter sp. B29-1]PKG62172.1 Cys-tRNA(Pro) deacylase [Psychrobacter sp. Choline-02u-13]PKH53271.1 Cys-tRNA(Pro) deacylase [Psychrobacter sp. Choline-02u-9]|tara:strand:- start:25339 stop:25827 length:489 start_codon:yes stop_codon:yes gene_type:complete